MPKKPKAKKAPFKFTAIVRRTFGSGKKAVFVDTPITVDFRNDVFGGETAAEAAENTVQHRIKCLNAKEINAAFKQWEKEKI